MKSNTTQPLARIFSIDILRGVIMIIMALDHVRDYFTNVRFDPLDLSQTTPLLFFTRWITHFCAPTFIFLSGASAWLAGRKRTKKESAAFLFKRGLWLIFLELTIIGFGWQFDIGFHLFFTQVIWAIGWSMIFLSVLVFLPNTYIATIGLILIFGHNLLDPIQSAQFGSAKPFWMFLHESNIYFWSKGRGVLLFYPIIPWIGVMAVGYAFGTLFALPATERKPLFIKIGLACLVVFLILRIPNIYGDPFPWQHQAIWWKNILAVIKVHKYPPSLAYLLMTLGISIIVLALLEGANNRLSRFFTVYGKVPFFYYLLHIYLIHILQIIVAVAAGFNVKDMLSAFDKSPDHWGFSLPVVYLIWIAVIAILYLPCRWFMQVKSKRKDWWLSYI
ncbi:heparan-alpha-glucosaminide N-acetyltransferase domain-containing protein [Mucilaginibacter sp. RS28]|uniref:Heparan-alpha-glucosaminide N-acetyltransferase domain-containing protein n=1 Tax=Mucilaginibacter straminoryzae TaxID=2932774 RepID=A0A9X1X4E7_9SPHI|nr:heparan-alpha-glucosaminide N-acetyltransferase domain-containing protein [Mucilaginibacter straminoryzae]MCJ8210864.1 heparan-alpha-glucosaminide N-acetyltransferase domain-containing protein [Mucilaginibacter straminoryzae]